MSVEETVVDFAVVKTILYSAVKDIFSPVSKKAFHRIMSNKTMETSGINMQAIWNI